MKKVVRKITSAVLVLVIVLCSLSIVAFAEDTPVPMAACQHPNVHIAAMTPYYKSNGFSTHTYYYPERHTCVDCGTSFTVIARTVTDGHVFKSVVDSNGTESLLCTKCGYVRPVGAG